jgi:glutamate-ammonia-ligase adenylyltransferase
MTAPTKLEELARRSALPATVGPFVDHLIDARGDDLARRLDEQPVLAELILDVALASRSLSRVLLTDAVAIDVLTDLDHREPATGASGATALVAWKRRETLRIAARDLVGIDDLEQVGHNLAAMAEDLLAGACRLAAAERIAVIGMGKLGASELNYSSDIDLLFVGEGGIEDNPPARGVIDIARQALRVDTALRPEGRAGALVRTLDSYRAYWDRWARPWEFQALLKARFVAGNAELGDEFVAAANERIWDRRMDVDAIAELRSMKARSEGEVEKRGLHGREIKRGHGGIRDIEFAVQLLQLVHGPADPALRVRGTLPALAELARAGYVAGADAAALALAYRFLRIVEHRLQLVEEAQVHTVPTDTAQLDQLARGLGFRAGRGGDARQRFVEVLARHQTSVRAIHERLYFRPLLESFGSPALGVAVLTREAAEARLSAFGFRDSDRTRQALAELTEGLTRRSRLMQQMLPLILDWCSESPDPDQALHGLRTLAHKPHHRDLLAAVFRESPEVARRLCLLAGTSRELLELVRRDPDVIAELGGDGREANTTQHGSGADFDTTVRDLRRLVGRDFVRIGMRDILAVDDVVSVGDALSTLAERTLAIALESISPRVPIAVIAMGRLGGSELAYGSDLDVLLVHGGEGAEGAAMAEVAAESMLRLLNGATPSARVLATDLALRPEGRQGALVRSLDAFSSYYGRYVQTWERQALLRARPVAGDPSLASQFMDLVSVALWGQETGDEEVREIRRMKARIERERLPPAADPRFHLKLGRGSLSDVEWTVQLLQLQNRVPATGTMAALDLLTEQHLLSELDAAHLRHAYRFCETTRNRWHLVGGHLATSTVASRQGIADSLPQRPEELSRLARSLGTTPRELREEYLRVTRRARAVVDRVFYGSRDQLAP